MTGVKRVGSAIRVRPEHRERYLELHSAVWPEVEATLTACNIRNYTIWRLDDLLFASFEYVGDDYAADMARIAADPDTQRWWHRPTRARNACPAHPTGSSGGRLPEVWHLD